MGFHVDRRHRTQVDVDGAFDGTEQIPDADTEQNGQPSDGQAVSEGGTYISDAIVHVWIGPHAGVCQRDLDLGEAVPGLDACAEGGVAVFRAYVRADQPPEWVPPASTTG